MTADTRAEGAPPDAAAAADRLEAVAESAAEIFAMGRREYEEAMAADVLALVAGFRAAVERVDKLAFELTALEHVRVKDNAYLIEHAVAAERRLAELQQALEAIADGRTVTVGATVYVQAGQEFARAALAGSVVEPAQDEARSPKNGETRGEEQP